MVLFGKSLHRIGSMLPNPLNQITSNTNIKCAISLTGQKVNSRLFHDNTFYHLDSRLRGNDGRVPAIVNFANAEFHSILRSVKFRVLPWLMLLLLQSFSVFLLLFFREMPCPSVANAFSWFFSGTALGLLARLPNHLN